jgi:HK97 family phage prohead protease
MPAVIPGRMERRDFPLAEIQVETRSGSPAKLRGHSAVFNTLSENLGFFREKIRPGAFAKSIQNDDIRALFNHNPDHVLGRTKSGTLALSEDVRGLYMEVKPPDSQVARDLVASIKRGDIDQQSFGFQVIADDWSTEGGLEVRELIEVKLFDVSPVTFPAYLATDVSVRQWVQEAGLDFDGLRSAMVRCFRGLDLDRSERLLVGAAVEKLPILRDWPGVQAPSRPQASDRSPQAEWLDVKRRRRSLAASKAGRRQMADDADDDPKTLAQAIDQTLDEALDEHAAGNDDQAWQLVVAAAATGDALLMALGAPDSDETADSAA